jgi:GNAT superfamily N-acetyltransferase
VNSELSFRLAESEDAPRLEAIRRAAFAPVFASFRTLLGEEVYEITQRRDDEAQGALLQSLFEKESGWQLYVVETGGRVVGFCAVRLDRETGIGEIGLNAVEPGEAGKGIGTALYEFAVSSMKEAGIKVATVGTGGDPSHAPARRAYQKAGFDRVIPSVWMYRKL